MAPYLLGSLEVASPVLFLGLYAVLIGFGVQSAVAGYVRFPRSLGLTAGVGLSLTALLMVYSHRLLKDASLPIVPLAIVAIVAIAARLYLEHSRRQPGLSSFSGKAWHAVWPGPETIIPAILTVIVMIPVLKYGLTAWTYGTNDFPSYASSADIWMNSPAIFAEKHPDAFGSHQLFRATHEKPIVTATLVLTSKLSSYPPYQLLTPVIAVLLFVAVSSLLLLSRTLFGISHLTAGLAISLPTFSIIPVSRLYDAQTGQVAAVALLACLLAVLATCAYRRGWREKLLFSCLIGVVGAAALGANFTLIAGSSVMLGAMALWLLAKKPFSFRRRLEPAILGAVVTVVLSAPMARMYLISFSAQSTGVAGFDIPLASPLALIGQQISLTHVAPENQVLWSWCLVIILSAAVLWARQSGRFRFPFDFLFLSVTIANALLIGIKLGWNNYGIHKWLAVFIALTVPLLIAYGISLLRGRSRIAAILLMVPLAASSAFFGLRHGFLIQNVISKDLLSLKDNEILAAQDSLNVRLGDLRENSIAALIVPARHIVLTEQTYARASLPGQGMSLVRQDHFDTGSYPESTILNDTYAMVPTFLQPSGNEIKFTNENPGARHFLFGSWSVLEGWGTWSGGGDNYVLFRVPEAYRGGDVEMTVTGTAYVPTGTSQTVDILANDELLSTRKYPSPDGQTFKIRIPKPIVDARDGRMMINFRVAQPYSPSQFGSADGRSLGFGLTSLSISPAE